MIFEFSDRKNKLLFKEKGVLKEFKHPNTKDYPHQQIFVIDIKGYTYSIPYVIDKDKIFLKTIYPNRKKMYLLENK